MNNKQILIKPNLEVFNRMGVKDLEIKNIILNTRTKKIIFDCLISSIDCIKDIDIIYDNVSKNLVQI